MLVELAEASSEGSLPASRAALDTFQSGVALVSSKSLRRECRYSIEDMRRLWGVNQRLTLPAAQIDQRIHDFQSRMRGTLIYASTIPDMIEASTGMTDVALKQAELLPLGVMAKIRRSFDYLSAGSINNTFYEVGILPFKQKVAVPHLDRETTDLCRNRVGWQVRPWDRPFVDRVSGAGWLHGPFVGAGLLPAEGFHYCRTFVSPFG